MATLAPAVASKSEQATALRNEGAALTNEIAQLTSKVGSARSTLGQLESRERELAEAAADGKPQSTSASAEIRAKIADAKLPLGVLETRLREKQARLDTVRATIETLNREIASEAAAARRQERFDTLRTQGETTTARINNKLRSILEEDFPALNAVRDGLRDEFVGGRFSDAIGPEVQAARSVIHALERAFFDGSFLAVERALLKQGWTVRGDLTLTLRNLNPPTPPKQ